MRRYELQNVQAGFCQSMKITKISADLHQIPVHRDMHDAIRHFNKMDVILVRLETNEGIQGYGFTYSIIPHGAREICSVVQTSIDSLVKGMNPLDHEQVWYHIWRKMDWVGRGGIAVLAVAAVDIAVWDLKSKVAGIPLHRLLGGYRDKVPVYNTDGGWLNHSLEQLVEETREIVTLVSAARKSRSARTIRRKMSNASPPSAKCSDRTAHSWWMPMNVSLKPRRFGARECGKNSICSGLKSRCLPRTFPGTQL